MKSIMRRSLAIVMAMAMLLSVLVIPAFAESDHTHTRDNDPCEHAGTDAVKTEKVEPTCQVNGGIWHTCTVCGDVWVTDEVARDPNAHKMAGKSVTVEATCWREGYTTGDYCLNEGCDYNTGIINRVPMYSHDPEADNCCLEIKEKTLADCLEGGEIIYECRFKDYEADENGSCTYNGEADVKEDPQGHKHQLLSTGYQAPTCHLPGWVTLDCTACDDNFKVAIAAKGHDFVFVEGVPAICYEQGYYEGYYCANEWIEWDENGVGTKKTCSAYYITEAGHVAGSESDPVTPEVDKDKEALAIPATDTHNKVLVWDSEKDALPIPEYNGEPAYQQAMCGKNAQDGWQWWVCAEDGCEWEWKETLEPEHEDDGTMNAVTPPTCTTTGYTTHKCKICHEYYEVDETPIKHTWVSTGTNVVYTFVKDGKTFVKEGDLRELPDELNVTIDYIPYMVPVVELDSDVTAQKLIADGYTQVAWTIMTEVDCGVEGNYVHKCAKCPAQGFLTIVVNHVWDGDTTDVDSKDDIVKETCTTPGGYMGTCENCGDEFILSASMVGTYDSDYKGEIPATGHKDKNGNFVISKDATGKFLKPFDNEVPATCIALGTPKFNYCNNEDCSEHLDDYDTALAAVKDTLPMIAHQYYDEDGVAYAPITVDITCMFPGFKLATCKTCGLHYNLDDDVNGGVTTAYEHRIGKDTENDTEFGEADGVSHVYPAFGEEGRPVVKQPTCAEGGRYDDVQCTLCPNVDIGKEIPVLDPGSAPTYTEDMKDGDVIKGVTGQGWLITITAPTCTQPGKVEASCIDCAANQTDTHDTVTIHTFEKTGIHFIKGATYLKNENGTYATVKGSYVVDRATLANAIASCDSETCAEMHIANAGGCTEKKNDLHAAHYECADCGDVIFFSVRLDHIAGATECGKPTTCTECEKVLVEAEPHVMAKIDNMAPEGDDNNCATEFYYHIACTECGFGSKSQGFEWTDEWKVIAEYVAAQEHDYDDMEDSTCEKDMECVREGCDHVEKAKKNHDLTRDYQNPTCITLGYNIYRCSAGELCDKEGAVVVEIEGVKYAEWREVDANSVYADHDYDVDNDGVNDAYLVREGNCLTYNALVYRCENCYGTATKDENGFISHGYIVEDFRDPTGHKLVDNNTKEDCDEGGCYWKNCEYCFDEAKYDAGEDGLWNTKDWKGDLGYTEKTFKDPTGHWYYPETATPEEIEAGTAEKIFFDLDCVDLVAHNNPVCADCGQQFMAEDYHIISKEYTLLPTCTGTGLSWKYCTNEGCGYKDILRVEPALGHTDTYWKETKPATCCEEGTAVLACRICNADVKEGEEILKDNIGLVRAIAEDLTKTLEKAPHVMVKDTEKSVDATIHTAGKLVKKCISDTHECTYTESEDLGKLDIVEFSATIDNAVKPGHKVFVNGGKIAYTIFIDGEDKTLYGLNLDVLYDAGVLTFVGFDLGADNANIFGTLDPSGACNTWVDGDVVEYQDGLLGVVSILATASPANNEIGFVEIDEKQEFVTLYFDINADTVTDSILDEGYITGLALGDVALEAVSVSGDESDPDVAFANDYEYTVVNASAIVVEKLGDVNVIKDEDGNALMSDNILNVRDVRVIEELILSKTYDARADINQDGNITGADLLAVQRYIVKSHTYAEMVGAK